MNIDITSMKKRVIPRKWAKFQLNGTTSVLKDKFTNFLHEKQCIVTKTKSSHHVQPSRLSSRSGLEVHFSWHLMVQYLLQMNLCSDCHCLAEREHCKLVVVFSSYLSPFVDEEVKIHGWSRFVHFIQAVSFEKVSHRHSVLNVKWVHHQGSFQEQPNRCRRDGLELYLALEF